jgi:hypothetical protein
MVQGERKGRKGIDELQSRYFFLPLTLFCIPFPPHQQVLNEKEKEWSKVALWFVARCYSDYFYFLIDTGEERK